MTLEEWSAAAVEPSAGSALPAPDEWSAVELPGTPARFAGSEAVAYRTQFPDPREGDQTRAVVTLRGLYARGRVWLNGDLLGSHGTYFEPARFVVDPEPTNDLVVECQTPDDRFGGVEDTEQVPPTTRVPSVRWGASVEGLAPAAMTDVDVRPRIDGDGARFEVGVTVDAATEVDDTITFSLRPEGFRGGATMERAAVEAAAGERTLVTRIIDVRDPHYWYPAGRGPQHRYVLGVRFRGREVTRTTGLATVERDDDGLLVNGRRVAARGFTRLPGSDPREDVRLAREANANFVRAHAHVPSPEFHRACDDAGLLVCQDLPLTGPGGFDIDRGRELAQTLSRRCGHHPSVGAFVVHDDPRDPFASPIGGGRTGRLKLRWRLWRGDGYNADADGAVAEAFPDGTEVFPVAGPLGTDPDAAHLYPGWDYGEASDVEWLLDRRPALGDVVTEFGAGAVADDGAAPAAGFDRDKHDARVAGGVEDSQAYQARTVKTVAEALRRRGSHAMAAFALRDPDDGAGMGVLARDGTPKAAYEALGAAFEPVQVVLDERPSGGDVATTVLNDTGEAVSGRVTWRAGDESGADQVSVDPHARSTGPTVAVPGDADAVELELSLPDRTVENRYTL